MEPGNWTRWDYKLEGDTLTVTNVRSHLNPVVSPTPATWKFRKVESVNTGIAAIGQSSSDFMIGTWKLNLAKSTYSPGPPPKGNTFKWEPWEGGFKSTNDGVTAQGQAFHTELIGKFDDRDYALKGAAAANTTRAYRGIDGRTFEFVQKTDGKVTATVRSVTSHDGKTVTQTATGINAQGQTINTVTAVYDKQ